MICPYCNKEISGDNKYCGFCGSDLNKEITCFKCNFKLSPTNRFCPNCGTKIDAEKETINTFRSYSAAKEKISNFFNKHKTNAEIDTFTSLKKFFIWSYVLLFIGSFIAVVSDNSATGFCTLIYLSVIILGVLTTIRACRLIFWGWSSIQGSTDSNVSPSKAVLYLFIPFFNLYWNFVALRNLIYEMNKYLKKHNYNSSNNLKSQYPEYYSVLNIALFILIPYTRTLLGYYGDEAGALVVLSFIASIFAAVYFIKTMSEIKDGITLIKKANETTI